MLAVYARYRADLGESRALTKRSRSAGVWLGGWPNARPNVGVMDVWADVARRRVQLADEVDALDTTSLEVPSWCSGWRVRDVLGHLVYLAEATQRSALRDVVRLGPKPDKALDHQARALGDRPVEELTVRLRTAEAGVSTLSARRLSSPWAKYWCMAPTCFGLSVATLMSTRRWSVPSSVCIDASVVSRSTAHPRRTSLSSPLTPVFGWVPAPRSADAPSTCSCSSPTVHRYWTL